MSKPELYKEAWDEINKVGGENPILDELVPRETHDMVDGGGSMNEEFIKSIRPVSLSGLERLNPKPSQTQVGGGHYKDMKIQPIEFIMANNIPYIEGNVIKYICRHRSKNGIQDLEKAKHYIDLLIEHYEKGTQHP